MTPLEAVAVFAAGVGAGSINAVVGSGSLITFPTLLALGYPPVVAIVSNNVGLVPGGVTGVLGYRAELKGQRGRIVRLGISSVIGSIIGGLLLLRLPEKAFEFIVPILIGLACVLVISQPYLNKWLVKRRQAAHPHGGPWLRLGVLGAGIYGGYFAAAQGVVLIGLLGSFLDDNLQRVNAVKNVLTLIVNASAATMFVFIAPVDWHAVAVIALGTMTGGYLGARLGRKLPTGVLRGVVVVVGVAAIVNLLRG
ncbi:UPF0721 transmembrane protein [Microtetraspora sp. NBRC 13810]|uniref:sulfite exporter TauE/SafE family protein n=1 Tax=Microtetraspora sp. NBRC 13810 TaxID=3030990 RepID=UPI002556B44A|nr:sulfite exporter TauE/SafE family protein [Microtetraspora sp. NBRC 13810]GLW08918.1 UPF0721 transmembrane protein [Microtetraspora sp. NBRC 13810]